MINILLVDDQALLCEVLRTWLDVEQDIQVVGVAHNGQEAIDQVETLQPDIVLMDIDMPQMNGLQATQIISQRFPQVKVIFLSGHDDDAYLGKSLRAGAKGYLLKNTTAHELVQKIRSVYNNVNLLDTVKQDDSVTSLQLQLEEMIETYRLKFENLLETYDVGPTSAPENTVYFDELKLQIEQRLEQFEVKLNHKPHNQIKDLEEKNQSSWKSIRKELINVNSQFNQANLNLSKQFNQQLDNLRQDLESKVTGALDDWSRQRSALQEWAVQRDEMRPSMEDFELRNRQELMSVINPIRASFGDVDQKIKRMQNWLTVTTLLALVALGGAGFMLYDQVISGSLFTLPTQNESN